MRCRSFTRKPMTWTELANSDVNEDEMTLAILLAARELIEDQEREIAQLKKELARARF